MRLYKPLKCHCDSNLSWKKQSQHSLSFERLLPRQDGASCRFTSRNDNQLKILFMILILFVLYLDQGYAQSTRGLVNDGVDLYKEKKFSDAEVKFKKGKEQNPESFESIFNLGDAFYKQQKYEEAIKSFQSALVNTKTDDDRAKIYHNIGNSLLKSQKIKESIGAYKESLKLNPNDQETKYNLSYALNMLKNQDQNQQKNKDDQNKDQNKDEQNKDQQQDQQQKQQDQQKEQQPQQPNEQDITKQEAKQILDALKDKEKNLQKQLRKFKGRKVKTEKDW